MNTTDARNEILQRIRNGRPAPEPLPDVPMYEWPGDPVKNFVERLESFDGEARFFETRADALAWFASQHSDVAKKIYSALPDFKGNFSDADAADRHNACNVDVCIAEGLLGVGEMGAIWVTDASLGITACALLCTDLFLLLPRAAIVPDMHRAYAALDLKARPYGSFFTGPSATADIEAVHVTGAQSEISLTALIYG